MIHVVRPNDGKLGTLRVLAGEAETRGQYFAFESETPPSSGTLDVHAHTAYDESEYVLSGTREIVIEDQRWEAGAGLFALAPRHARHGMGTVGSAPARWLHFFSPAGIERYFREREQLREKGATAEELRALSAQHGASAPSSAEVTEPAYAIEGLPRDGRVVATGRDTRDAYAVVERSTLPEAVHEHADQEEAFYVLSGELTVEAEGVTITAAPGTFVLVPRGVAHRHIAAPDALLLAVYSPGHAIP
jgi:quercetin dioxygenase-like cupin family protein